MSTASVVTSMTSVMDTYGEICQTQLQLDLKLHHFLDKYKLAYLEGALWTETFVTALSKKHEECCGRLLRNLTRRAERLCRMNTVADNKARIDSLDAFVDEREGMMSEISLCYRRRRNGYNVLQRDYFDNVLMLSRKSLDCCAEESQKLHNMFDALVPFVDFYDHTETELEHIIGNHNFTGQALTAVVSGPMQTLLTLQEARAASVRNAGEIHAQIGRSLAQAERAVAEQSVAVKVLSTMHDELKAQVAGQNEAMDVLKNLVVEASTPPRTLTDAAGRQFDVEQILGIPTKYEGCVKHLALLETLKQQVVFSMIGIEHNLRNGSTANA